MDPKAVEVYQGVGRILHRYSAGKLPKAFKIIPNLRNWEDVLFVTEPEQWSPHSVYQATRLFISNLNAKMVSHTISLSSSNLNAMIASHTMSVRSTTPLNVKMVSHPISLGSSNLSAKMVSHTMSLSISNLSAKILS